VTEQLFGWSIGCIKPYAPTALAYALAGVAAVGAFAAVGYLAMPWWRIKRRMLQPLDRVRSTDLHTHLDQLVARMGLASRPTFWLAPEGSAQGVAFGRQGRCHIQLNAGLVKKYRTDPDTVTAVVLHELAHVRNRDIRYTYLAVTTWWAFAAAALAPYLLIGVLPLVMDVYPQWWPAELRASSINGHAVISVLALTVLAYLTYTAILRVRESHADATVAAVADGVALRRVLQHSRAPDQVPRLWGRFRRLRPGWDVLNTHPSVSRRLMLLNHPVALYSISTPEMIGTGIAIAVVQTNLNTILIMTSALVTLLPTADSAASPMLIFVARLGPPLLINGVSLGLIAALACVTTWRARLRTYPALLPPPATRSTRCAARV
jgi:Zn-dependent protease with chaperone function